MEKTELHERLDALGARIDTVRETLRKQERWTESAHLTRGELEARYRYLKSELNREIEDLEAHGHHVSDLESSVRRWIDGLELKID